MDSTASGIRPVVGLSTPTSPFRSQACLRFRRPADGRVPPLGRQWRFCFCFFSGQQVQQARPGKSWPMSTGQVRVFVFKDQSQPATEHQEIPGPCSSQCTAQGCRGRELSSASRRIPRPQRQPYGCGRKAPCVNLADLTCGDIATRLYTTT